MSVLKSAALVVVPILCGVVLFVADAPALQPGVYVLNGSGVAHLLQQYIETPDLSSLPAEGLPMWRDAARTAAVLSDDGDLSFYIVGAPGDPLVANAAAARLVFFAANHADPAFSTRVFPMPVTTQQVHALVHQVKSPSLTVEFDRRSGPFTAYEDLVADTHGSRSTIELFVGLIVRAPSARLYAARLGRSRPLAPLAASSRP